MKINRRTLILIGAALVSALALAASQGMALPGDPWWYAEVFWPNFFSFIVPSVLAFALIEACNRIFLPGDGASFARKCTWWAFGSRLVFLVLAPIGMLLWGYESNWNLKGLVELDAINANETAWRAAQSGGPVLEAFQRAPGDNTGGITVLGVVVFRLLSPDLERTLLLGLIASAFTSLTVIAVYRLAGGLFSPGVAKAAALIAAIFPEAVMIGSSHQQMGYMAIALSVELLAVAGLVLNRDSAPGEPGLPKGRRAVVLLIAILTAMFFLSRLFFILGIACGAVLAIWLSDPRKRLARFFWIGTGLAASVLIILRILGALDVIPSSWDVLFAGYRYLYGMAWEEFEKMAYAGGGDLFQTVLATMEKGPAFLLAAVYGLVQPVLPAAIGHRSLSAEGGAFWQVLGIYRSLGWYLLLPVLIYGTLKSLRGIRARNPETILMVVFWFVAFIGSYRAFGDQWDNPRYRLFVLAPMAILAAWAWMTQRESGDPWFKRIVIPFAVATVGLTIWYLLRDYAMVDFPVVGSILMIGAITIVAFILSLFLVRQKKTGAG